MAMFVKIIMLLYGLTVPYFFAQVFRLNFKDNIEIIKFEVKTFSIMGGLLLSNTRKTLKC